MNKTDEMNDRNLRFATKISGKTLARDSAERKRPLGAYDAGTMEVVKEASLFESLVNTNLALADEIGLVISTIRSKLQPILTPANLKESEGKSPESVYDISPRSLEMQRNNMCLLACIESLEDLNSRIQV